MGNKRIWILALALLQTMLLTACGQELPKPEAKSLAASSEQLAQIPALQPGPYAVERIDSLLLSGGTESREVRLLFPGEPAQGEYFPLLLFSHGNWSDRDRYDNLLQHWVSHGYVVVAPTHLDGRSMLRGIFNSLRHGQMGLIEARVEDLRWLLDQVPALGEALAPHNIVIDDERIAITGHSFGAFTAQQFAGAAAIDAEAAEISTAADSRVRAVLAISPPGPMFEVINEKSWLEVNKPMLVTTGTWDSNPQFWPDWRAHLLSHDSAQPGHQYALVVEGADHYLGNLICRPEREVPPQHDALAMVNAISVSFLDAYLKGDQVALAFLRSSRLQQLTGDFAVLSLR